ncbi:MAG: ATP-binding protein [Pseudomonadota bacterium]
MATKKACVMSDRQRWILKGDRADDHLAKAGHRIFASMALLAGTSAAVTTTINVIRGETDPAMIAVAVAGILYCYIATAAVFVFDRFRPAIILVSSLIVQGILMWLAISTGLLISTPILFLLMMVPAVTAVSGIFLGGLSALATIGSFAYIYAGNHADDQITLVASSFIDWRLLLFALPVCAIFLWMGTCLFRNQMVDAARKLEAALIIAEKSERAKSDFLANMSHEIRTPMNGVIGMLDVALAGDMEPQQRQNLEVARRSADSLVRILTDILDLTKLEQGHLEIERTRTDVWHLIEDGATLFSSAAAAKGVGLATEGVRDLPRYLQLDGARLGQILSNLVANAVKFTDQGSITISTRYEDGIFLLSVEDTGCGMPKDFLPQVFQRFQQAAMDPSSRRGGTGLGLAICRDLTQLMDGHIGVVSEPGKGTRFDVALPAPACDGQDDADEPARITIHAAPKPEGRNDHPLHILVAEDNAVNRSVLGSFLTRLGHSFVAAEDGHEAVEFAREGNFDMIIMDVSMPRMDGIDATREIRALDIPIAHAPIIMLTAHAEERYLRACIEAGADAILHKPITQDGLAGALGQIQDDMHEAGGPVAAAR